MVEIFVYFVLKSITRKLKLTKISLHNNVNNYVLRHYAELYEYENLNCLGCGQLLSPKNGRLDLMIGLETDSEKEPEKAFFSCNPGYHLVGPTTLTCRDSSWEGKEPVCQRKSNH